MADDRVATVSSVVPVLAPTTSGTKMQQPVSLQQALLFALLSGILGGSAGSGVQLFGGNSEVATELQALRSDIKGLNEKIDSIYFIVDHAHPRKLSEEKD